MTSPDDGPTPDSSANWSLAAQRHYDPNERDELTTVIVSALADARGVSPVEVKSPTLFECIDAPALEETFFGPSVEGHSRRGVGCTEFRYADFVVKVRSDGWVMVFEAGDDS